ncbi:MAG: septum formation initiator family protein [Armatimonadetes bacterium]|nr:septum formation initiator family protein [Armatimonadota bacterium]
MRKEAYLSKSGSTYEPATRPESHATTRERLRPVRRRRKRSVWRKTILPLFLYSCVIVAVVFLIGRISRPFVFYDREIQATQKLQNQVDAYRAENAALERRIKYLQTPEGAAQAARELGWVKPGEITLVIPSEKDKKPKK